MSNDPADLWVFAYGSLMWRPGFAFAEAQQARLTGFNRALCIYSVHYRGTRARPGLVLGLDRGGTVEGVAYRVAAAHADAVRAYLRDRELIYGVYREARLPVQLLAAFSEVRALTYVAERRHPSYAGALDDATRVRLIRSAAGVAGTNIDYVASTMQRLLDLGIREPRLDRLAVRIGALALGGRGRPDVRSTRAMVLVRALASRPSPPVPPPAAHDPNRFTYRRRALSPIK